MPEGIAQGGAVTTQVKRQSDSGFVWPAEVPWSVNQWGGDGQCKAELAVGDMGYYRLRCDLADNHPELHWDSKLEIVWTPWTQAQRREEERHA